MAQQTENELFLCFVANHRYDSDKLKIRIASPIFAKNLYQGLSGLPPGMVPISFFDPDFEKFPKSRQVTVESFEMKTGECIFIPAYWFWEAATKGIAIVVTS